ncbi:membrane protein insertase YidC [Lactobacillus mulieris]|jgi:membrane protein insertase, yidC/oxa1 family|uniref:Membrane protein insertase YidC n=1 Tax=Lactobacillus mulieris TaxID=2508708 RepID=A0AAP3GXY6_9LACO|nr:MULTISPECIES: membrane protein insertase YidC [Lactobacillus]EEU21099.1 YidC/Oxa1 family membrane protein insertase [Lactobacillus jensenii 27-2-CHN]EEX23973.1 membrane protein insertase, YidC/Oxa1 family [Lactobacillus jensenii 115-3-CHN]EFH29147.1 membrane protein insertase, YidC/Oxa1 family [Lactobacillus jensenii JV-V16]KAA9244416.1 membrane protein insertase YidC [Lactobacillus jensenii]KAA9369439.1 membrane protein insertase YidC [Lactobacillus jensenii]
MKKNKKILLLVSLVAMLAVILTGCAAYKTGANAAPKGGFFGLIYQFIGIPIRNIMLATENAIGGTNGAGWAIAIITAVIRFVLLPLMLSSSKKSTIQQEKVSRLQDQFKLIQDALKDRSLTPDKQMQISQLQQKVYRENNLSITGGIGCLPLIVQFPFMIGIYQAVAYSDALYKSSFFGVSLGKPSLLFAIVGALFYLAQSLLMLRGVSEQQRAAMQSTIFISPLMTLFISMSTPGALGLYFLVGGIIALIQQVIVTYIILPRAKAKIDAELKEKPMKVVVTKEIIDDIIGNDSDNSVNSSDSTSSTEEELRKRNAGKQKRENK